MAKINFILEGRIRIKNGDDSVYIEQRDHEQSDPLTFEVVGKKTVGNTTSIVDTYSNGLVFKNLKGAIKHAEGVLKNWADLSYWA